MARRRRRIQGAGRGMRAGRLGAWFATEPQTTKSHSEKNLAGTRAKAGFLQGAVGCRVSMALSMTPTYSLLCNAPIPRT